jgi:hypothetical protein
MQRFGSHIYALNKKKQVLALAIYMVITLPKGIYNTKVEATFFAIKLKLLPHVNPHSTSCYHPCHGPKIITTWCVCVCVSVRLLLIFYLFLFL